MRRSTTSIVAGLRAWRPPPLAGRHNRLVRQFSYLLMLFGCLAATVPLDRVLGLRVLAQWRRLLVTLTVAAAPFLCWDFYAVAHDQWSFDADQTLGVDVPGGLPLEEVAFFAVIPLAMILSFEAVLAVWRRAR
jgi:lycopene cyclase domain-containing protein